MATVFFRYISLLLYLSSGGCGCSTIHNGNVDAPKAKNRKNIQRQRRLCAHKHLVQTVRLQYGGHLGKRSI